MVLARIVEPLEFGLLAIVMVIYYLVQTIFEAGLNPIIQNRKEISENERDTYFVISIAIGVLFAALLSVSSKFIEGFYGDERLGVYVFSISASILFLSFGTVSMSMLQRDKLFRYIAISAIAAEILSTTLVIILHYLHVPDSVAFKPLCASAVNGFLLLYISSRSSEGRPKFGFELKIFLDIYKEGLLSFLISIGNYFSRNLDTAVVGKLYGTEVLGYYDKSYQLMRYPIFMLTYAMLPGMQPSLRKFKDDLVKMQETHDNFMIVLGGVASICGLIFYFYADFIVQLFYGKNWGAVVPLVEILSATIPLQIVLSSSSAFFYLRGRIGLLLLVSAVSVVLIMLSLYISYLFNSVEYLCFLISISFFVIYFFNYFLVYKFLFPSNAMAVLAGHSLQLSVSLMMIILIGKDLGFL